MAGSNVTLEIDPSAIRLVETVDGKIIRWASLALDPAIFEDGMISDPLALSTAIRQLMDSSEIRVRNVIASVNGLYSVSRIMAIPRLTAGGMTDREAVLEAARDIMPLPEDDLYLFWQTLLDGEDNRQVLVVGVPKDMIDNEVQALKEAGINPQALDLKPLALARAVDKEQAIILNIDPSSFDIIIVVNSVPEVMRTIAWQSDNFAQEDMLEYLAMNLELTVGFYNSHHRGATLDPEISLLVTGQMSGDLDLMGKLSDRVGYLIEPMMPPLDCPKHMPVSQYAVSIGLALKGRETANNEESNGYLSPDINLLPDTYKPWKPSTKQLYFAGAVVAGIALLIPLYQLTSGAMAETSKLRTRYNTLNNKMQLMQADIVSREPLRQTINDYNAIVSMDGGFTEDLRIINEEADRLRVILQSIAHNGDSIVISCRTEPEDYIIFREFVTTLRENERFATVTPPSEKFSYITGGTIEIKPAR